MTKVAIVDDEESGINVLRQLLHLYFPEIEIISEYTNITDAEKGLKKTPPDILFLDIQMPDGSGFKLLENMGSARFAIVFITAYDQYAIKALKMSATDYLLKPINRTDLQFAIEKSIRYMSIYKDTTFNFSSIIHNISLSEINKTLTINKYKGDNIYLNKIICVEADSNYSIIHTTERTRISVPKPLKEFEDILCDDSHSFIRIHKSIIINRSKITKSEIKNGIYTIYLENDLFFQVAKRKKEDIKNILFKMDMPL